MTEILRGKSGMSKCEVRSGEDNSIMLMFEFGKFTPQENRPSFFIEFDPQTARRFAYEILGMIDRDKFMVDAREV